MTEKTSEPVRGPRIYATSDVHTDYVQNMDLLRSWTKRKSDVLILAGDVSHKPDVLRQTFEVLLDRFAEVFYCPGNHDLWLHPDDGCSDSVGKYYFIQAMCDELGVRTRPAVVGKDSGVGVLIVPLLSWYHSGFDTHPDVLDPTLSAVEQTMMDFHLCKWPDPLTALDGSDSLARFFDSLNEDHQLSYEHGSMPIISFSHFLPHQDLLPEKRALFYPPLAKVVGSSFLGERVKRLSPDVHVFGHTHYAWSMLLDKTRYVQACLAYPRERDERRFSVTMNCEGGREEPAPLLVYDHELQFFHDYHAFWSNYYAQVERTPTDVDWIYGAGRDRKSVMSALQFVVEQGLRVCVTSIDERISPSEFSEEEVPTGF